MEFLLSLKVIDALNQLEKKYREEKKITETEKPQQPYAVMTWVGATNYDLRLEQIQFLQSLGDFLNSRYDLMGAKEKDKKHENDSPEALIRRAMNKLNAIRALVSACLFIRDQTSSNSTLRRLINEALGISANNRLDDTSLAACYVSTQKFMDSKILSEDEINPYLLANEKPELPGQLLKTWEEYNHEMTNKSPYNSLPITNVIDPIFTYACSALFATIGLTAANLIAGSNALVPAKYKIVALMSGGLYLTIGGLGAGAGTLFVAPMLASQFVTWLFAISLGQLGHYFGTATGHVLANLFGMPLDYSWVFVTKCGSYAWTKIYGEEITEQAHGVNLITGAIRLGGVEICARTEEELKDLEEIVSLYNNTSQKSHDCKQPSSYSKNITFFPKPLINELQNTLDKQNTESPEPRCQAY